MRSASGETSVGSTPGGTFCLEVRALSLTEVRSWVPQATAAATKASGNARIDDRKDTRHAPFVGISDLLYAIATRLGIRHLSDQRPRSKAAIARDHGLETSSAAVH